MVSILDLLRYNFSRFRSDSSHFLTRDGDTNRSTRSDTAGESGLSRRRLLTAVGAAGTALGGGSVVSSDTVLANTGQESQPSHDTSRYLAGATKWYLRRRVTDEQCLYPNNSPELYGPTALNAQSSNQRLAVGIDREGTMTVVRWPRPSFYEHLKHKTSDRDRPRFGAYPNTGAFLGLVIDREGTTDPELTWLRTWESSQQYVHDLSDTIKTEYRSDQYGLMVTVSDLVAAEEDAFVRRVTVQRDDNSAIATVRLVAFENFNLVVSKHVQLPIRSWCEEWRNEDTAVYDAESDAIIHTQAGVDASTGIHRSVAIAMGFDTPSDGYQVGGDAYEPAASSAGEGGPTQDAYDDATDGELRGNETYTGQTTGALATPLDLSDEPATATLIFAAAEGSDDARATLDRTRDQAFDALDREKRAMFDELLADAPLPNTDDPVIRSVATRALVTLVSNYDPQSGAIIASIASQSPYYLDWVRDGAYFNYVLDLIGLHDWVETRNRWYADIQQSVSDPRPSHLTTPPGNWAMNYYADGIAGGPIPYEIDETGYGLWTLWDHYEVTGDATYLDDVYPAIRRAANYLVTCQDPITGLQCPAPEDDHLVPSQTIVGATMVWLGLDSAVQAARELGHGDDAVRYETRRDRIEAAIDAHLWDPAAGAYGTKRAGFPDPALAWPACFKAFDHPRMQRHLEALYHINQRDAYREPEAGTTRTGLYEAKSLIPNAMAWNDDPEKMADVREGLRWIAHRHATPDTHVMGEVWLVEDNEVKTTVSQPHTWEQVLFYLASLETHPPEGASAADADCGGVLDQLRQRSTE